jgi:guanylate kinase
MVLPRFPVLREAISATTRARRAGEKNGVEYWFLSDEDFQRRIDAGELLEWVRYVGNCYGTLRSEVDRIRAVGGAALLELETRGALEVKDEIPGAVTIFVTAPLDELERRLRERATESSGVIEDRLTLARQQLEQQSLFDHVVVNDNRERAAEELASIVERELAAAATMGRP